MCQKIKIIRHNKLGILEQRVQTERSRIGLDVKGFLRHVAARHSSETLYIKQCLLRIAVDVVLLNGPDPCKATQPTTGRK